MNGLKVRAVRARYNGENRNPWNEFECGSNYARSMASYDLLLAFSGFEFDMVHGMIGFNPVSCSLENYGTFWSLDSLEIKGGEVTLRVINGRLELKRLRLPFLSGRVISTVQLSGEEIRFGNKAGSIDFKDSIGICAGNALKVIAER